MTRPIDELLPYLLDFIRASWPLLYAALIAGLLHFGIQKLKARQLQQQQIDETQRPVVFDEKLKRFRRFETEDQFLSVEEFADNNESNNEVANFEAEQEDDEDDETKDSGHASFSADSIGVVESSVRLMVEELHNNWQAVEQSTRALYSEDNNGGIKCLFVNLFIKIIESCLNEKIN
jgi:hypothetical protein